MTDVLFRTANPPFMRLPREVRLTIYEYVLVVSSTRYLERRRDNARYQLYVRRASFPAHRDTAYRLYDVALIYVSKTVREECLKICYLRNIFHAVPFNEYVWNHHSWLSYKNIRHLAFRLENGESHIHQAIHDIVKISASGNLKSCSLVMEDNVFHRDLRARRGETMSSVSGYVCNVAMHTRLSLLKYCSRELSGIESKILKISTIYHPDPLLVLMRATRQHDASIYLHQLHLAFSGELWLDGTLYCRNGSRIGKLPFPFGCHFRKRIVNRMFFAVRQRQIWLNKLLAAFGEQIGLVERSEAASHALSLPSPLLNGRIHLQIQSSLRQARECFDRLNPTLIDPDLTEGLLEQRFQEWKCFFDSKTARLPDPSTFPINTFWQYVEPTMTRTVTLNEI